MNKIKKAFLLMLSVVFCLILAMFATACGNSGANNSSKQSTDDEIVAIYNMYVADVTAKGNTPLGYEEWLETVRGQDGRGIASARINENGEFVINFTDGSYTNLGVIAPNDKYVTDISVVGNVISITFNDGTTAQYTTDGTTVCNHENLIYVEMVPHKENPDGVTFTNGVYLELCPDCGSTTTVIGVHHNLIDTVVAPTCTENGYTYPTCTVCGYVGEKTDIVSALGHAFEMRPLLGGDAQAAKRWCEEGGIAIEICSRCNLAGEYQTISRDNAPGHHSDSWKVSEEPTWDNVGQLTGMCMVCGNVVEMCIPACRDEAYVVTNVTPENASCSAEKKGTFIIEVDGQKIVIEDVAIPGSMHILNGEFVDDKETMIFTSVEALNNAGYKLFGNPTTFPCNEASTAYFTCDKCNEIIVVNVRKRHASDGTVDDVVETPATCERSGKLKIKCATCNKDNNEFSYEEIPALGHDYVYEWNEGTMSITGVCSHYSPISSENRCDRPFDVYRDLDAVKSEVIKEATCQKEGLIQYTLCKGGNWLVISVATRKLDHVLERADGTTERISLNRRYCFSDYPEMTPFANAVVSCAADFGGQFTCSECHENIAVTLYIPHTVAPGTLENVVKATCVSYGTRDYECDVCKSKVVDEIYQWALGHDYVWELVDKNDSDDGLYHLIGTCQREYDGVRCTEQGYTCDYASVREPWIEVIAESTCAYEGLVQYTINDTEVVNVVIPKTFHTLNGVKIDDTKVVPSTTKGVKIFANADESLACSGDGVPGYFTCDVCQKIVQISVVFPHTKPALLPVEAIVEATCDKYGTVAYDCAVCGNKVIETIAPEGHNLVATTTYDYMRDVITVTMKCTRTYRDSEGYEVVCGKTFTKVIYDGRNFRNTKTYGFKLVEDVKATCAHEGHRSFAFFIKDFAYPVTTASVRYYDSESDGVVVKLPEVVENTDGIKETLNCTVSYVIEKLDHKFVQTESKDVDGNVILDAGGNVVVEDKIFTFEVVEMEADGTERVYVVSYKLCKDCGKVVEVDKVEKPADEEAAY